MSVIPAGHLMETAPKIIKQLRDSVARVGKPMPICNVCDRSKPPLGRSVAPEMANSKCGYDCDGYRLDPSPDNLWPGEPTMHEYIPAALVRESADVIEKLDALPTSPLPSTPTTRRSDET